MEFTHDVSRRTKNHSPDFSNDLKPSLKSSLRLRYMAEVEVLKRDLGGLEDVRNRLGLSRRKMCQALLVDPSAWTRWTRDESKVPPHIWKMLHLINLKPEILEPRVSIHDLESIRKELQRSRKLNFLFMGMTIFALLLGISGIFI